MTDSVTDTELLDWLEKEGLGYALVSDDFGRWACSGDGMQNVPKDPSQPSDICTTHFIEARDWKPTIREAIEWAKAESENPTWEGGDVALDLKVIPSSEVDNPPEEG